MTSVLTPLPHQPRCRPSRLAWHATRLAGLCLALLAPVAARAQTAPESPRSPQACAGIALDAQRLACFDAWVRQQDAETAAPAVAGPAIDPLARPGPALPAPLPLASGASSPPAPGAENDDGCHDSRYSLLSRQWELESGSSCGTFRFRGYRPLSLSVVGANWVNPAPSSPAPQRTATQAVDYRQTEMRIQLSVRAKVAQGMLTPHDGGPKDSLWVAYTQQSYWQLFSPEISRPFRTTDHEPELIYVLPVDMRLPQGWRLRYAGLGLVHQSNGQSLPLSRSWNRVYLMAGAEVDDRWMMQARVWKRLPERNDDNPDISDWIGRAEWRLAWRSHRDHTLAATLRHSLDRAGRGSVRLEWLRGLGGGLASGTSNLQLHTQLFWGYGDSLADYNRRRTVFSVGLSLLDF